MSPKLGLSSNCSRMWGAMPALGSVHTEDLSPHSEEPLSINQSTQEIEVWVSGRPLEIYRLQVLMQ